MNEIKIRFKSGEVGYFKLLNEDDDIDLTFNAIGDAIRDNKTGVVELIDLIDGKKTMVNIVDISTFGYNKVY